MTANLITYGENLTNSEDPTAAEILPWIQYIICCVNIFKLSVH